MTPISSNFVTSFTAFVPPLSFYAHTRGADIVFASSLTLLDGGLLQMKTTPNVTLNLFRRNLASSQQKSFRLLTRIRFAALHGQWPIMNAVCRFLSTILNVLMLWYNLKRVLRALRIVIRSLYLFLSPVIIPGSVLLLILSSCKSTKLVEIDRKDSLLTSSKGEQLTIERKVIEIDDDSQVMPLLRHGESSCPDTIVPKPKRIIVTTTTYNTYIDTIKHVECNETKQQSSNEQRASEPVLSRRTLVMVLGLMLVIVIAFLVGRLKVSVHK